MNIQIDKHGEKNAEVLLVYQKIILCDTEK
jgi:hypothetical protein